MKKAAVTIKLDILLVQKVHERVVGAKCYVKGPVKVVHQHAFREIERWSSIG